MVGDNGMATQSVMTSTTFQTNSFYASIMSDGNIMMNDMMSQRVVGVTLEKYNQLQATANQALEKAEGYYKQLVEAGIIQVPKTVEQQLADLMQVCQNQSAQIATLTSARVEQDERISRLTDLLSNRKERNNGTRLPESREGVSTSK